MYEVMIEEEFAAAHALRGYKGKCENLHGHNYKVEVYVRGEQLDNIGMLVDFTQLKAVTRDLIGTLDHQNLNELKPFDNEINPSAENLAGFLLHRIAAQMNNERAKVYKVRVWETSTSSATYEVAG
jgi:6-pyruvoyltetrahydropterin/6-carboxytetrahydropterin synthase